MCVDVYLCCLTLRKLARQPHTDTHTPKNQEEDESDRSSDVETKPLGAFIEIGWQSSESRLSQGKPIKIKTLNQSDLSIELIQINNFWTRAPAFQCGNKFFTTQLALFVSLLNLFNVLAYQQGDREERA